MKTSAILTLLVIALTACSSAPTPTATSLPPTAVPVHTAAPTDEVLPTNTPAPTKTPQATDTPEPTRTPLTPSATPAPTYSQPLVLAEVEGTGEVVTDNYEFPKCQKAVFYWTAYPTSYGSASLILKLFNVTTGQEMSIVNEFAMDVLSESLAGSAIQALAGGKYYFATENTDQPWKLRVECQDVVAPVAVGTLNVEDVGNAVTGNYELPACNKSVFAWEVSHTESGTASMMAYLVKVGSDEAWNLVNEFAMDRTQPLEGEALQKLSGGEYYLYVFNTGNRPWSIHWQCQD